MKKATFEICSAENQSVNPGDLIFWSGCLLVAINKTSSGILARDCKTGKGIELSQNDKISIVKDIQIENR